MIDAHIHLHHYKEADLRQLMAELPKAGVEAVIAVSTNMASCQQNAQLLRRYPQQVLPAYGYHPEQPLPDETERATLFAWIRQRKHELVAVGEVGLPYYNRQESEEKGEPFLLAPYIELLEQFIMLAKELDKPIVLHAVYEDAEIACDLLENHGVCRAHFHWFKGSQTTVERMIRQGYYISVTPDVWYETDIQLLVRQYPLELIMAETDGPWPFTGPFAGQMTHPRMVADVMKKIAQLKEMKPEQAKAIITDNTKRFYQIQETEEL